jgi:hypothetical protein
MTRYGAEDGQRGEQLGFDDDGGVGLCSQIQQNLEPGDYELTVQAFGAGAHAGYTLTARLP